MMFNGNLKQLFTMMVLAAAGRGARTVATQADSGLVTQLPKSPVSRRYPRCSEGERIRRMGQILSGTHRRENGLVWPGQLISRPATAGRRFPAMQIQRPY